MPVRSWFEIRTYKREAEEEEEEGIVLSVILCEECVFSPPSREGISTVLLFELLMLGLAKASGRRQEPVNQGEREWRLLRLAKSNPCIVGWSEKEREIEREKKEEEEEERHIISKKREKFGSETTAKRKTGEARLTTGYAHTCTGSLTSWMFRENLVRWLTLPNHVSSSRVLLFSPEYQILSAAAKHLYCHYINNSVDFWKFFTTLLEDYSFRTLISSNTSFGILILTSLLLVYWFWDDLFLEYSVFGILFNHL